ncbi:unnamed protein product [Microthlaspi erraticum]|uniref:Uncharacterized protein n=1 Tax=Microthlaspi erraticum TaxID=1685480 RepID=A0A6D2JMK3_9BRAS|nr:unnamed protein product [Microthlaspi erraticum]
MQKRYGGGLRGSQKLIEEQNQAHAAKINEAKTNGETKVMNQVAGTSHPSSPTYHSAKKFRKCVDLGVVVGDSPFKETGDMVDDDEEFPLDDLLDDEEEEIGGEIDDTMALVPITETEAAAEVMMEEAQDQKVEQGGDRAKQSERKAGVKKKAFRTTLEWVEE